MGWPACRFSAGECASATQYRQGAPINTNLKGRLVHSPGVEQPITLTEAVVTPHRIALDWSHDGQQGHLIAKSTNGTHFSGRYGYGRKTQGFECELTLYKSNHEDLLYGTWRQQDTGQAGTLILRLPSRAIEGRLSETARPSDPAALVDGLCAVDALRAKTAAAAEMAVSSAVKRKRRPRASKLRPAAAPGTSEKNAVTSAGGCDAGIECDGTFECDGRSFADHYVGAIRRAGSRRDGEGAVSGSGIGTVQGGA